MKSGSVKREVAAFVLLAAGLWVGSLLIVLDGNRSYWPTSVWLAILAASIVLHIQNFVLYSGQIKVVTKAEAAGLLEPGSSLLAVNQRFRYAIRLAEAAVAIAIGVLGVLSISHPSLALHPSYGALVLAYLYGSVSATGYLSLRDLRVIRAIRRLDQKGTK